MNWTNFELTVERHGDIVVYTFKQLDTINYQTVWIVGKGVTTVTGDLGNWVFCKEFHPCKNQVVSRGYLDEKLEIYSVQESKVFDTEATLKAIQQFKDDFEDNYGEMNEEDEEWIEQLDNHVFDKIEYEEVAFRQKPGYIDYEDVPYGRIRQPRLELVYDAFEEMCKQVKD